MNVAAFVMYALDKFYSQTDHRRISEGALLTMAILSGAYGAGMGMLLFKHKTLHRRFKIVVPLCFALWLVALVLLVLFI